MVCLLQTILLFAQGIAIPQCTDCHWQVLYWSSLCGYKYWSSNI